MTVQYHNNASDLRNVGSALPNVRDGGQCRANCAPTNRAYRGSGFISTREVIREVSNSFTNENDATRYAVSGWRCQINRALEMSIFIIMQMCAANILILDSMEVLI